MAEELTRPGRFYCYQCKIEITPRYPDCICPQCESGFIEELPEERSGDHGSPSTSSASDQDHSAFELFSGYGPFTLGILGEDFDLQTPLPTEDNQETENRRERESTSRQRCNTRQPWSRRVFRRQSTQHEGEPTIEGIIQQLINGIIAPTTMSNSETETWTLLHSAPLDYVWGANGLDAIIAQLMNQYENTGPPPADREQIKRLPTVSITEEHVDAGLECPVCKEDYSIEENVRQLPCNHLFHNDCIVPWLEQHDTCPVCRKSLTGQNTATDNPSLSDNPSRSPSSSTSPPSPPPEPPSNGDAPSNT